MSFQEKVIFFVLLYGLFFVALWVYIKLQDMYQKRLEAEWKKAQNLEVMQEQIVRD